MSLKPKRIMVVEDELLVAEDIAECLRFRGFEVCGIAKSSDEALAIAREHKPHLALMDIVIQGDRDGIETAAILRSELEIPVIFLTAYSQEKILERAKTVAPLGYVVKPFEEASLISTVEIAIHKSGLDEELRKSEEWFSTTLSSIGDGVIATDAEGRVKFLNHLAENLTGWQNDEAAGRSIEEIFPILNETTRHPVSNPAVEALQSGQIRELANHTILVCRDGREIPIDDSGAPIRSPEGKIVGAVLIFRDVTEKKTRDKEIFRYQQRLEELVAERTSALAHRVELERAAIEISAELIRLNEENFEQGLFRAMTRIGQILELDGCGIYETSEKDGRRRSLPVCVWTSTAQMEELVEKDQPAEAEMTHWSQQMAQHSRIVVRTPDDVPPSAKAERALLESLNLKALVCLPLGSAEPVRWTVSFSSHQAQHWGEDDLILFQMFANVLKSVLERRELEAEQKILQQQLNQSQKLEAIGKLTGGIAHDFNNMLVPIMGYADTILDTISPGQSQEEVKEIRKAAESAASLTSQLLAFSRKQILQKQPLCINSLIQGMEKFLKRLLGEDIRFHIDLHPEIGAVEADKGQMEQVLMNLCVNARDAMPDGGDLWIRTRREIGSEPKDQAIIEVADSGCGIDKATLEKIFDPFFSTKGNDGTGLGLSVVLGVVEQHDGWVHAESEPGRGTIFSIGLPTTTTKAANTASEPRTNYEEVWGDGQRILLIEDEPAVLLFVSTALKKRGYHIIPAENKTEAIRVFEQESGRFDLIFTDAKLPDGNGIEVLEHIYQHNPKLPALISSGYTDDRALVDQAAAAGSSFCKNLTRSTGSAKRFTKSCKAPIARAS